MPAWRRARCTAQRPNSRLQASTPGMRRSGSCGTVQSHSSGSTCRGRRSAARSLRTARLRSRPEPPGVRMPGESTYSTGRRRARRLATWWLLVRFSACQSLPKYTTPSPCNPALAGCSLIAPPAHQPGNAAGMDPVLAQARDALQVRFHPPEAGRGDETGHQAGLAQVAHPLDRRPGITRVIKHLAGGDQVEPMALLAPGLSEDVTGGELRLRGALPCPGDRLAAHVDAVDLVRHFGEPAGLVAFPAPQFQQRANPAERLLDDRVGGVEARVLQLGIHVPGVLDVVGQFQALV